jgi:histidine triad (HIT) family protein
MSQDSCIFCKIIRGEIPARIVAESEHAVAFDDINPQAPVHTLIIPRDHVERAHDLDASHDQVLSAIFALSREVAAAKGLETSGYRLVINNGKGAGQEVYHLHLHLLGGRQMHWPPG